MVRPPVFHIRRCDSAKTAMRRIVPLLLIGSVATSALAADTVVEEIIARVNNQIVTRSEYLRSKEQLRQEAEQQDPVHADKIVAEREKDVLRDLIDQQLLIEKGKDLGITADTELIKKLDEMRKQMNLETMDDLEKAAQGQGVSFEDFKQNLRNQIITQQVIGKEVGQKLNLNKEEEKQFYEQHKDELAQPEQVQLGEILISTEKKSSGDEAQQVTAAQAGDLGYFKRGMLAKELEDKTFAMKVNDVSDVIRTKQGFVILRVTEHQAAGVPPLSEVEPRVQDAMYMEKLQPALRAYLQKLREESFIEYKPGYVDTGASPNQTNPIETSEKEAAAKQLKKKKKLGIF